MAIVSVSRGVAHLNLDQKMPLSTDDHLRAERQAACLAPSA
jgi:hypothetical protein